MAMVWPLAGPSEMTMLSSWGAPAVAPTAALTSAELRSGQAVGGLSAPYTAIAVTVAMIEAVAHIFIG
jgi:hypothetical protein